MAQLPEYIDGLPNICGREDEIERVIAAAQARWCSCPRVIWISGVSRAPMP
jgi:hypothetical protein